MDKRSFMRIALAGGAGSLFIPRMVLAERMPAALKTRLSGGVYHDKVDFGRWNAKLAELHLARSEKEMSGNSARLHVESHHPMNAYEHYIVKHELLDGNFKFLQEHRYDPKVDKTPAATFDLGSYRGRVYVMTFCNVHDLWIDTTEV